MSTEKCAVASTNQHHSFYQVYDSDAAADAVAIAAAAAIAATTGFVRPASPASSPRSISERKRNTKKYVL